MALILFRFLGRRYSKLVEGCIEVGRYQRKAEYPVPMDVLDSTCDHV
jgi:hypothetical protein